MDLEKLHKDGELNAYKLAEFLGVTHNTAYNYIKGKTEPKYSQMLKIKEFLDKDN